MTKIRPRFYFNERGFTLIEMLLVLVIVGVTSSIVLHISFTYMQHRTYTKTINQIELTVRMAQLLAMEEQRTVLCEVVGGNRFVVRGELGEENVFEQHLPEGMQMEISTARKRIRFQPSGNVTEIGKIIFYLNGERVFYTVNLGKGRFILYE